VKKEEHNI